MSNDDSFGASSDPLSLPLNSNTDNHNSNNLKEEEFTDIFTLATNVLDSDKVENGNDDEENNKNDYRTVLFLHTNGFIIDFKPYLIII